MSAPRRSRTSSRSAQVCGTSTASVFPSVSRRYLTVKEAAAYLNTSERFVRRLIADRRIAFHKLGSHVRLREADLEAFLLAGRVEPITTASFYGGVA